MSEELDKIERDLESRFSAYDHKSDIERAFKRVASEIHDHAAFTDQIGGALADLVDYVRKLEARVAALEATP